MSAPRSLPPIPAPNAKLPFLAKALIIGSVGGLGLMVGGLLLQREDHASLLPKLVEQLGEAIFIAMLVGIGVDRLFHIEHLTALAKSMTHSLNCGFQNVEDQIGKVIPQTFADMAGGHRLKSLADDRLIYDEVMFSLQKYAYFTNTIIDSKPDSITEGRKKYYELKAALINQGDLICRELISENSTSLIEEYVLKCISPKHRQALTVGIVDLSKTLPSVINFSIFQHQFSNFEDAVLMLGWFSRGQFGQAHNCIVTDHPDLVRTFSEYFELLAHGAREYLPKQ